MSEVDWQLIDKLDRRFQQLVGISSPDHLQHLLDNFHLVDALSAGRLDELLERFMLIRPQWPDRPDQVVYEQLRQYEVDLGGGPFTGALLEAADVDCRVAARAFRGEDLDAGGRCRLKLVKFGCKVSLQDVAVVCGRLGLQPARIDHLARFVDRFPASVPDKLLAPGSLTSAELPAARMIGIPCLERGGARRFKLAALCVDGIDAAGIGEDHSLLTIRVPLPDATSQAELL